MFPWNVPGTFSANFLCECSLSVSVEGSLNIPFERYWNVEREHSENIALERSRNPEIFLALGTFHGNVHGMFSEGIVPKNVP